jgi:hypothetical protein
MKKYYIRLEDENFSPVYENTVEAENFFVAACQVEKEAKEKGIDYRYIVVDMIGEK